MKIEMDGDSSIAAIVISICIAAVAIGWMAYRYNSLAYEKGYTQVQLTGTQNTMWVKGDK